MGFAEKQARSETILSVIHGWKSSRDRGAAVAARLVSRATRGERLMVLTMLWMLLRPRGYAGFGSGNAARRRAVHVVHLKNPFDRVGRIRMSINAPQVEKSNEQK